LLIEEIPFDCAATIPGHNPANPSVNIMLINEQFPEPVFVDIDGESISFGDGNITLGNESYIFINQTRKYSYKHKFIF